MTFDHALKVLQSVEVQLIDQPFVTNFEVRQKGGNGHAFFRCNTNATAVDEFARAIVRISKGQVEESD